MHKRISTLMIVVLGASLAMSALASAPESKVRAEKARAQWVVIVRHAEKSAEPAADPVLTPAGQARASSLVEVLKYWAVDAVVTTQWQRTRATAAPIAVARSITPVVVATDDTGTAAHAGKIAAAVREADAGTILVVGHSNTVPAIIAALGGPVIPEIGDNDYDNLFVMRIGDGSSRLLRARY